MSRVLDVLVRGGMSLIVRQASGRELAPSQILPGSEHKQTAPMRTKLARTGREKSEVCTMSLNQSLRSPILCYCFVAI
jgi:hypothetical protein